MYGIKKAKPRRPKRTQEVKITMPSRPKTKTELRRESAISTDSGGFKKDTGFGIDNAAFVGNGSTRAVPSVGAQTGFGNWRRTNDGLPGCRSFCERSLVCWLVVSLIIIAGTVSCVLLLLDGRIPVWKQKVQNITEQPKVCITPSCVQTAGRMIRYMNHSADPCQDFYTYACGNWVEENYIPIGYYETTVMNQMQHQVTLFFKEQLEHLIKDTDVLSFRVIQQFYKSCKDFSSRTTNGFKPAMEIVNALGGIHVSGSPWNREFDLTELLVNMTRYNSMSLFDVSVLKDGLNSSRGHVVTISPPKRWANLMPLLDQPRDSSTKAYKEKHQWLASLYRSIFRHNVNLDVNALANEVLNTAISICTYSSSLSPEQDYYWNAFNTEELSAKLTSKIDWVRFLKVITNQADIHQATYIYVVRPDYFTLLDKVLGKATNSSVNNLIFTSFLIDSLPYLSQQAITKMRAYYGTPRVEDDSELCVRDVLTYYPMASEMLYIHRFFNPSNKGIFSKIDNMTDYIRKGLAELIKTTSWIDIYQRSKILDKVAFIRHKSGFYDYLLDEETVERYTTMSQVIPGEYYRTVMNLRLARTAVMYQEANFSIKPFTRALNQEFTVNAWYNPQENLFKLQTAILTPPIYSDGAPNYINYGSLGFIIGHEMNHGFDVTGSLFDKYGHQVKWWTLGSYPEYSKRSQCYVDEYEGMAIEVKAENQTFQVNGTKTLQENIADVEGIKAAFQGYMLWKVKQGTEMMLPGFHDEGFSQEKLFFIATAQVWCQRARASEMERIVENEVHSPNELRVQGMMRNSKDFAKAFSCKEGTPMNPSEKCSIW